MAAPRPPPPPSLATAPTRWRSCRGIMTRSSLSRASSSPPGSPSSPPAFAPPASRPSAPASTRSAREPTRRQRLRSSTGSIRLSRRGGIRIRHPRSIGRPSRAAGTRIRPSPIRLLNSLQRRRSRRCRGRIWRRRTSLPRRRRRTRRRPQLKTGKTRAMWGGRKCSCRGTSGSSGGTGTWSVRKNTYAWRESVASSSTSLRALSFTLACSARPSRVASSSVCTNSRREAGVESLEDKNGNPPGIIQAIISDPKPHLLKIMIKRLVRWNVLPTTCVPDSCIVNIYEPGDCIPPHNDSRDFVRPFCTVSFLSECNIHFGTTLKVAAPGEFIGSFAIPLPVGSLLVLNGNGADVAKHCVPAVPTKRTSITFRKMDPAKRPFNFKDDPELLNIDPLETGRSSDEGKSKLLDVQIRNLSKISRGKRSKGKGRTAAGKAEGGFLRDHRTGHARSHAVDALSQQNLHGQQNVSAAISEGERNSAGRSRESKYHSNVPGMHFQVDLLRRHGNGMSASEDGVESWKRKPAMEHRQISMINRTIKDGVDSFSVKP